MIQGEKILPHPDILNEVEYGRFVLTNLAAKRARQIKEGAPPLVRIDSGHPLSIALAEIAAGKIKPVMASDGEVMEGIDYTSLDSLEIGEIGLVLSEDEDEMDLLKTLGVGSLLVDDETEDEDHDEGTDTDEEEIVDEGALADLMEDDEEQPVSDDADISLDDLAEQEEEEEAEDV